MRGLTEQNMHRNAFNRNCGLFAVLCGTQVLDLEVMEAGGDSMIGILCVGMARSTLSNYLTCIVRLAIAYGMVLIISSLQLVTWTLF